MFWRRRTRLDEEVESHLAEETADNIARGMDPVTARHAARRTFGNVGAAKEKARELDPLYWLDTLWQDTRFAFRLLQRCRLPVMSSIHRAFGSRIRSIRCTARLSRLSSPRSCGVKTA